MRLATFVMILLVGFLVPVCDAQSNCLPSGIWGEWAAWHPCPANPNTVLNFKWRKRYCLRQPPGCIATSQYTCL
ncbi:unnamed protein product [Anisakis simplex]|uniref:Secreted protein n=1 Tax=Anisakis simplex TaxID=6269 RepID=A0A0M3JK09_ANISI|nr:unnamed protein product [Anisakis simplex]